MVNPQNQANPYIIGGVINNPNSFFGRQSLFEFIQDNLVQGTPVILLYGQRRIGKSSVLKQIPRKIDNNDQQFIFVNFDLQVFVNHRAAEHSRVLNLLATSILRTIENNPIGLGVSLGDQDREIISNCIKQIGEDITSFHLNFLREIYTRLGEKKLVLLLDEFDVISNIGSDNTEFFEQIINQWLSTWAGKLFVIPVVGQHLKQLPRLLKLLGGLPYKEITLLDQDSAERLIIKPAQGILTYQREAIDAIYQLSSGHPYFTQVICYELFALARERNEWIITKSDVETIVNPAIESGEGGLAWFWEGVVTEAQVILSAAAEVQYRLEQGEPISDDPLLLLKNYGILTATLTEIAKELFEYGFLDTTKRRVKVEFVRRWLLQRHRLKDEIIKLEDVHRKDIDNLISVAQNHPQTALELYKQALELNPNNFQAVTSLAQHYLQAENFDQAFNLYDRANQFYNFYSVDIRQQLILQPLQELAQEYKKKGDQEIENLDRALLLYEKAYEFEPEQNQESLITTLEQKGHYLTLQRDFTKAKEQFERVLSIDATRTTSQNRLAEIIAFIGAFTSLNVAPASKETTNSTPTQIPTVNRDIPDPETYLSNLYKLSPAGLPILNKVLNDMFSKLKTIPRKHIAFAGILAATVFSVGVYHQVSRTCPLGEKKELGIFCAVDTSRISRGDKTFFPNIKNINRDQGITEFKRGNYKKAIDLFGEAVKVNRNDPEVLIYQNNARARDKGSPFQVAVVISITDTRTANSQEILRGVAQAQEDFNQKSGGLDGRFLEVVIANDSNDSQKAKQIGGELVKDTSILAVVGHSSSRLTEDTLPIYAAAGLPIISPTATSTSLNNSVFFRAVYSDEITGKRLAEYTYKSLQLKRAVIFGNPIFSNHPRRSPYTNSLREAFTKHFEILGGEVVRKPLVDFTSPTFNAQQEISKTAYSKTDNAEAVMLFPDPNDTDIAITIAREVTRRNERLRERSQAENRRQLTMLSGDSLYKDEALNKGGKDINGLILAIPWFRETKEASEFTKKSNFQWKSDVSWRTAMSFDATQALIKSLSQVPTRTSILDRLTTVDLVDTETSGYPLRFTTQREREGQSTLVTIENGKFVLLDGL
jgi:ABC-type branched-subunit amino acid transport system substrate-binding protein